jgi:hypothetical protein
MADVLFIFLYVRVGWIEPLQFYDARLVPDPPGDNLFRVLPIVCFDDCPAAMFAVVTSPFEMMEVSRRVDLLDDGVTVIRFVRGFDEVTIHVMSPYGYG